MNQRALFIVLLRVYAIFHFLFMLAVYFSTGALYYITDIIKRGLEFESLGAIGFTILFALIHMAIVALLIIYSERIAGLFFKEDKAVIHSATIELQPLLNVGLLLIAAHFLITGLPHYFATIIGWMEEQAAPIQTGNSVYSEAMFEGTVQIVLVIALILRARYLSHWLSKLSQ